jgi:aromatic-L-amino-acid decarboxylase
VLTARGRTVLRGIERADSVTLDPHKGMFLPYGTGSLLVRDRQTLRRAHAYEADYLPIIQEDPDLVDFYQISPELTRAFRGLRVWLPLKLYGIGPFRRNLEEKLDLTAWATDQLRVIPNVEIVAEPQLSLVAFRLTPPGRSGEALNELNRRFVDGINRRNRVHISGTVVDQRFVARICVLSFRTHFDRMRMGLEDIRAAAAELA